MKINVVYSTALALAVVLASTGCKHKPLGVTPIPGPNSTINNPDNAGTIGNTQPITSPEVTSTGIPPVDNGDLSHFNQDPSAFAAYTIHFAFDSAVIRDSDQASLQAVAAALQQNQNNQVLVQGNCDERGTEEYNRSLGERRALAAREALAGMGVNPSRVREISFGKDKPVDTGHDDSAWSKNRRDDFILLTPKAGMQ